MIVGVADVSEGDVFRMRRQHPCGGWEWRAYHIGPSLDTDTSDGGVGIGLECLTCKRRVTLGRRRFETRVKARVSPAGG